VFFRGKYFRLGLISVEVNTAVPYCFPVSKSDSKKFVEHLKRTLPLEKRVTKIIETIAMNFFAPKVSAKRTLFSTTSTKPECLSLVSFFRQV